MLNFLSRDKSNIARLQQLKQKADKEQANAKRLSSARQAAGLTDKKNAEYISLKKVKLCPPSEIVGLIERAEVKAVLNDVVDSIVVSTVLSMQLNLPLIASSRK